MSETIRVRKSMSVVLVMCLLVGILALTGSNKSAHAVSAPTQENPLVVDTVGQKVMMYAEVNAAGFTADSIPRHGIVFKDGSNGAKALFRSWAPALAFHEALAQIGAVAGNNVTVASPIGTTVQGSPLDVAISWNDGAVTKNLSEVVRSVPESTPLIRYGGNYAKQQSANTGCILCLDSCAAGITSNATWGWGATWSQHAVNFYAVGDALPADGTPVVITFTLPACAVPTSSTWYFAEGYTGPGFQEWLTIQNPNSTPVNVTIEYSYRGGGGTTQTLAVGADTRETVDVNAVVGAGREVSAKVTADKSIVAERPMYFNFNGITGGHDVMGANDTSTTWYFAEGYTGSGFQEWLTIQNPNATAANVTIEYSYRGGGGSTQQVAVGANTRETVDVNSFVGAGKEVSAKVTSDQPVVAERPMYFNFNGVNGGHNVMGSTDTAKTWYFAEGYTGTGYQEYITLQNPSACCTATVTVEYQFRGGGGTTQNISVDPGSRQTIDVNAVVGAGKEVSAKITSDKAIIAERPMYFNSGGITGGHDVMGCCATGKTWYFAEGYTGSGYQEWFTIQNPNETAANVTIQYRYRNGAGTTQTLTVEPNTRQTVDVNAFVGTDKEVSALITSSETIIAERPMYFNSSGIDGGHNVMGCAP